MNPRQNSLSKGILLSLLFASAPSFSVENVAPELNPRLEPTRVDAKQHLEQQAKQKVKTFAAQLKRELVSAIKSEGLHYAVGVCKDKAPKIAKSLSTDGWTVARTSLKTRNPVNAPDTFEKQILTSFDSKFKDGQAPSSLTASTMNEEAFRFMKAIPTGQVCLACHGQHVDPNLMQTIKANYPNDTATGFTLEDIRGAFTVTKNLSE